MNARRPRRAVRPPQTVGPDDARLVMSLPTDPEPSGPGESAERAAATRAEDASASGVPEGPLVDGPLVPGRSADDSDVGWGREDPSSNDDRLERERPPHW